MRAKDAKMFEKYGYEVDFCQKEPKFDLKVEINEKSNRISVNLKQNYDLKKAKSKSVTPPLPADNGG